MIGTKAAPRRYQWPTSLAMCAAKSPIFEELRRRRLCQQRLHLSLQRLITLAGLRQENSTIIVAASERRMIELRNMLPAVSVMRLV